MKKTYKVVLTFVIIFILVVGFYYGYEKTKPVTVIIPPSPPPAGSNNSTSPPPTSSNHSAYLAHVIGTAYSQYNYVPLKYGAIGTDLWNLKSATGNTNMTVEDSGFLYVNSTFSNVKSDYDTILGYPEVAYGYNLEDEMFGNKQSSEIKFPMEFSQFKNLTFDSTVNYSFTNLSPSSIPIDFSYDLWLEENPSQNVEPNQNDLEVMIWMYCQDNQPIGEKIGTFSSNITFNHKTYDAQWAVWFGKANAWPTVSFVLTNPAVLRNSNISLNISKFIDYGGIVSKENMLNHTLMGIEMGNEFGNENIARNISDWVINYYAFSVGNETVGIIGRE